MGQLVQQHGGEEQQRRDEPKDPVGSRGLSGRRGREPRHREREGEQYHDNQPAYVGFNVDTGDPGNAKRARHIRLPFLCTTCTPSPRHRLMWAVTSLPAYRVPIGSGGPVAWWARPSSTTY